MLRSKGLIKCLQKAFAERLSAFKVPGKKREFNINMLTSRIKRYYEVHLIVCLSTGEEVMLSAKNILGKCFGQRWSCCERKVVHTNPLRKY